MAREEEKGENKRREIEKKKSEEKGSRIGNRAPKRRKMGKAEREIKN